MKFYSDGPSIPDTLLERCDAGGVVFLCGAGVSCNSGMPTFVELTRHVIEAFSPPVDSQITRAFKPWLSETSAANVPLDQIFNMLHQEYGKDKVNSLITKKLQIPAAVGDCGKEHVLIRKISTKRPGKPKIITTNFDLLFECQDDHDSVPIHIPPRLPELEFGSSIEGITYLHGRLATADESHSRYIISSTDFGRAYLSEGWATKFISSLLNRYTVVLLGYQAEDPPVRYLLQGLSQDGKLTQSKLYAFDLGLSKYTEAKWIDRGVTAIPYQSHSLLWKTLEAWADRMTDPRAWRTNVIVSTARDPKKMPPHERGQVIHVLRQVAGAKLLAKTEPLPHPEWICVLDPEIRSGGISHNLQGQGEEFDPFIAYGVDEDVRLIEDDTYPVKIEKDNLLEWRHGDDNPPEFHRLANRQAEGYEAVPTRLRYLMKWISELYRRPAIAWWASRQRGLHPRLIDLIDHKISNDDGLENKARRVWNLILEYHRDPRNRDPNRSLFNIKRRLSSEGWTQAAIREFRRAAQPCLRIKGPIGIHRTKPPSPDWDAVEQHHFGIFQVEFPDGIDESFEVSDNSVSAAFCVLEELLTSAAGMLKEIQEFPFSTPSCYRENETEDSNWYHNTAGAFLLLLKLYNKLITLNPNLAKARAIAWNVDEDFFFRKLKIYAYAQPGIFETTEMSSLLLSVSQSAFWDPGIVRELLISLKNRWYTISEDDRDKLIGRILFGPDNVGNWSNEEYSEWRNLLATKYARYLQISGCQLTRKGSMKLDRIMANIQNWDDEWARSIVSVQNDHPEKGTSSDGYINLSIDEVVKCTKEDLRQRHELGQMGGQFGVLSKHDPTKALAALSKITKSDGFTEALWSEFLANFPVDSPVDLYRRLCNEMALLSHRSIFKARYSIGQWLKSHLLKFHELDSDSGWVCFDLVMEGILLGSFEHKQDNGRAKPLEHTGYFQFSRPYEDAINEPGGRCMEVLLSFITEDSREAGSLIPKLIKARIERLIFADDQGSNHSVSVLTQKLELIMRIDPVWTKMRVIPLLAFDHPAAEAAWSGLFHADQYPSPDVIVMIKPMLLKLYPWVEELAWGKNYSSMGAVWMAKMCIFYQDRPDGLERSQMRDVLRKASDDVRCQLIFWLSKIGDGRSDGWNTFVIPFIKFVWPMERKYCTSASTLAWVGLLNKAGKNFEKVFDVVKDFLVPVNDYIYPLYHVVGESDREPIAKCYPRTTLEFLDLLIPGGTTRPFYELSKVLVLVEEGDRDLTDDPKFLRLIDLVERS